MKKIEDKTVLIPAKRKPAFQPEVDSPDGQNDPTRIVSSWEQRRPRNKALQRGNIIKNRFRLEREIGRGGMGVVFAARDLIQEEVGEKESEIAIKFLSEEFKSHPDALRMLQQECKKAKNLAHPNIGTVYDFDKDGQNVYMTMALLSGCPLDTYMRERNFQPLPFDDVMGMLTDIVSGLDYAHQRKIIHSDLKPANIFLTDSGAKILDFGIARAVMSSEPDAADLKRKGMSDDEMEANVEGEIGLTLTYASLEMIEGKEPDVRDDIYGLACIVYELLSGKHPYERHSAQDALMLQLVPERIVTLKEWQWDALLKGLALKRADRCDGATDFLASLLPKRKEPWKRASYALALIAITGTAYFLFSPAKVVEQSLFENPGVSLVMAPAQQQKVTDMLDLAEVHMMVGRLIAPAGGNALDEYQKILELNPNNRDAIAGLTLLLGALAEQAESAFAQGNYQQAAELIGVGLGVHDNHERLLALRQQVNLVEN
ncbi:Serine/threonine protein kinase [hydrothermal vent metagenome]|uniref:Serine/threonine protein kinase n=1 Tax=hydrothermal vent metagenome TaxID=652676 RepID=A0A3B0ZV97_9ZZZZ